MVSRASRYGGRRSSAGPLTIGVAVACLGLACGVIFGNSAADATFASTSGAVLQPRVGELRGSVRMQAGAAPAPAPSSSVALVKVTEESAMTTAGVLGGVAGFLFGGVWVGAALFAATSYFARKENDDVAVALKGVSSAGLEVLNFGAMLNDKYAVTDKLGSAFDEAIDTESGSGVKSALDSVKESINSFDEEVGIKDTLGTIFTSGTELAKQAVDKAIDLNEQYKITDKIAESIQSATSKASTK